MMKKRIDNENDSQNKFKKSLGETGKRKELAKITAENYRLLKKIQDIEPTYNIAQWEEDNRKRVQYLRNITEFPDQYGGGDAADQVGYEITGSRPLSTRNGRIRPLSI
jgi:hypothetical protein